MTVNKEAEKKEIDSSHIYQDLKRQVKTGTHGTGHCTGDLYYLMERWDGINWAKVLQEEELLDDKEVSIGFWPNF